MDNINHTFHPDVIILKAIPGLEKIQFWISIPFCTMYVVALGGNSLLIILIWMEHSLHEPMYFFLAMLAMTDFLLCNTIMPKMLALFWFQAESISFEACITQMFFVIFIFVMESTILLAMAFDRYVAICFPLRYTMILTPSVIKNIAGFSVARGLILTSPFVFLVERLPFCGNNIITDTYCELTKISRLACADITANNIYTLVLSFLSTGLDVFLISISYIFILRAVFRLPSRDAQLKALGTCTSHVFVILMFYLPAYSTVLISQLGCGILLANLYVVVPPALNPIIYGVKTKHIRDIVIIRLFQLGLWCGGERVQEDQTN
ncbi:olfactory receptor 52B2-like [Sarcophilus harrisii]|uniref:olfactory receptor 52B2-like n=1 Tax=Sarcophilus harrisii TaxID=9305 RepID=UPI0013020B8B|nr:olfactory receptor 52B2-like [Sarcophilus harrisii]